MEKDLLFKELFFEKGHYVASVLRSIGCKEDEIEDIMQSTCVQAYEKFGQLKNKESFIPWFTRIAINEWYKKKNREKRIILLEDKEVFDKIIDDKAWTDYSVKNDLASQLLLKEAMENLPDEYLVPFKLNVIENYKYQEVSKMLKVKEGTIKSRINRAKTLLRKSLKDEDK